MKEFVCVWCGKRHSFGTYVCSDCGKMEMSVVSKNIVKNKPISLKTQENYKSRGNKMKKILLWLDDLREPNKFIHMWEDIQIEVEDNGPDELQIVWVKNYSQFIRYFLNEEMPYYISFDHDLGFEQMKWYFDNGGKKNPPDPSKANFREKTGHDCAKWLCEYCNNNDIPLPKYQSHSANPIGKENIIGLLDSYKKFKNKT